MVLQYFSDKKVVKRVYLLYNMERKKERNINEKCT